MCVVIDEHQQPTNTDTHVVGKSSFILHMAYRLCTGCHIAISTIATYFYVFIWISNSNIKYQYISYLSQHNNFAIFAACGILSGMQTALCGYVYTQQDDRAVNDVGLHVSEAVLNCRLGEG